MEKILFLLDKKVMTVISMALYGSICSMNLITT